jgi:CBS domain-containing protein
MSMTVRQVMTSDPACCTAEINLTEAAKMMLDNDCGEIPVVGSRAEMKPIGVITDRDIVVRALARGHDPKQKTVADCMSKPPVTVTEDAGLDEVLELMEGHQIRRVPVVDANGKLIGIVAQADIARDASHSATASVVKEVSQPGRGSRH